MSQDKGTEQYIVRMRVRSEIDKIAALIGLAAIVFGSALWFLLSPNTGYVVAATLLVTSFVISLYSQFVE